jgi:hypothetical protein
MRKRLSSASRGLESCMKLGAQNSTALDFSPPLVWSTNGCLITCTKSIYKNSQSNDIGNTLWCKNWTTFRIAKTEKMITRSDNILSIFSAQRVSWLTFFITPQYNSVECWPTAYNIKKKNLSYSIMLNVTLSYHLDVEATRANLYEMIKMDEDA